MGIMVSVWIDFCIDLLLRKFSIKQIVKFGSVMYVLGIILTMFEGHLDKPPMIVSATVKLYFSAFVTTRNGFFQSLVFVSIGMLVAETEKLGKLRISIGSIIATALMYLTKIATSFIGGAVLLEDTGSSDIFLPVCSCNFGRQED